MTSILLQELGKFTGLCSLSLLRIYSKRQRAEDRGLLCLLLVRGHLELLKLF